MASWREKAIPVEETAPAGGSWRDRAIPVETPAPEQQEYGYTDALKRGVKGLEMLGDVVNYGYGQLYDPITSLFFDEGENPITNYTEEALLNTVDEYQAMPSDPELAQAAQSFEQAYEDDGLWEGVKAGADDLTLDSIGKLFVGELPGMVVGGGVGGRVGREVAETIGQRIANEAAQNVAVKAGTGAGTQAGAVGASSFAPNLAENVGEGDELGEAVRRALTQTGVESAINAPAGALVPFNIAGGPVRNAVSQAGIQSVAGGAGYAGGATAVGKEVNPSEVALEAAIGGVTLPIDIAITKMVAARNNGVSPEEVTPEMEQAVSREEIDAYVAEVDSAMASGQLQPEQVSQFVDELVGANRPPRQEPQQARQTAQELGALFEGTDVSRRDDLEFDEEGNAVPREGAEPVRTSSGNQARPDMYGAQAIVDRIAQREGLTLTPQDMELAARDIANDPYSTPADIIRGYSEEGRRSAFDVADRRRQRKETDRRREGDPERDYAAGAGREEELTPRQRQDLEERSLRPAPGVNENQPGQPRNSTDRITTSALYGLRGDFEPAPRRVVPEGPDTGRTFDGQPADRVPYQAPRLGDESGIGAREQTMREADRQGRFRGYAPNDIQSFIDLARTADAAERAVEASNLPDSQKEAGRDYINNVFDGVGNRGEMSVQEAIDALDQYTREVGGEPAARPRTGTAENGAAADTGQQTGDAGPRADREGQTTQQPEPEPAAAEEMATEGRTETDTDGEQRTESEAGPTSDAEEIANQNLGGRRGFDQSPRRGSDPLPTEETDMEAIVKAANKDPIRAAEMLAEKAPSAAYRAIAKLVAKQLRKWEKAGLKLNLRIGRATTYRGMASAEVKAGPQYRMDGKTLDYSTDISLSRKGGLSYETLLHELVHAATQLTIAASQRGFLKNKKVSQAVKDLENLQRFITRKYRDQLNQAMRGEPGMSEAGLNLASTNNNAFDNVDEMVAWGLTNRNFQRFMEETPYAYGGSLWSRFVNKLRELLDIPAKQESALSELLRAVETITEADPADVMGDFSAGMIRNASEDAPRLRIESYQANDDAPGVSADPKFKPNKIVQAIRDIAGKEAEAFGFMGEKISQMIQTAREASGDFKAESRASKRSIMTDFWRTVLGSLDGSMRILTGRFNSDTLKSIPDMFHATAGKASGTKQTFDEAVQARNSRLNEIDSIISDLRDNGIRTPAQHQQVIRLVENPRAPRRGAIGDAANRIEKFLKEELQYLRDAGVEVGEVSDGYFPREVDSGKAGADPEKFITQATKAYRETGLSQEAATEAARRYWESVVYGVSGTPGFQPAGGQTPSFVQSRVFSKAAAKHLADFRVNDIDAVLGGYTMRATRRAEIARRFGDNWSEWKDLEAKMIEEDPDVQAILPQLRDMVAMSAGVNTQRMSHAWRSSLSMLRTFGTLATMPKAAMASLGELVIGPTRGATGSIPGDMAQHLTNIWGHFYNMSRTLAGLGRDEKLEAGFEMAEDIGIIAGTGHNSLMAARFAGGDPVGRMQSDILASFFRRNQLEHLTNYTRVTSMRNGQVFMRRLAKQMKKHPERAGYFLRELGVPKDKEMDFANWLVMQEDGLPSASAATGEFANVYKTALQRFVDQTVMRPSQSTRPRWASHPLGAVVFQLQAFAYAFQKNVINRQARVVKNLEGLDRIAYSASMLGGMALLVGMQGFFRYLRDELYNEEINDRKTTGAFVEGAVSQAGLFGVADPYIQSLTGVRYQKSVSQMFLGPSLGGVTDSVDALLAAQLNNSDNTNTAERNLAKSTYDWLLEPAMQAALTAAPAGPITGKLASFATIYAVPKGRDPFADAVAGPESDRKKPEIQGVIEWMTGAETGSKNENGRASGGRWGGSDSESRW